MHLKGGLNIYKPVAKTDHKSSLPYKIGYDLAGTVVDRGSEATKFNVGDEVICCLPFKDGGLFPPSPGFDRKDPFLNKKIN